MRNCNYSDFMVILSGFYGVSLIRYGNIPKKLQYARIPGNAEGAAQGTGKRRVGNALTFAGKSVQMHGISNAKGFETPDGTG